MLVVEEAAPSSLLTNLESNTQAQAISLVHAPQQQSPDSVDMDNTLPIIEPRGSYAQRTPSIRSQSSTGQSLLDDFGGVSPGVARSRIACLQLFQMEAVPRKLH